MAALDTLGTPGAPGICPPCDGWPHGRPPRSTGAGLEWFRHDGTGVANPGKHAMQRRSLCVPDLTDDIPDLHVDLLLHRPAWSFRSASTDARYTSIARAALSSTVRGELVRFALSRDDTAVLFAPGDPA